MTEQFGVYFIQRVDDLVGSVGWDETASAVIVAEGRSEARRLMAQRSYSNCVGAIGFDYAGDEGDEPWLSAKGSLVTFLGSYAGSNKQAHMVCRDFKRG